MSYVLSKKTVSTAKGVGVSSEKYPKLHLVDVMSDTWYPIPPADAKLCSRELLRDIILNFNLGELIDVVVNSLLLHVLAFTPVLSYSLHTYINTLHSTNINIKTRPRAKSNMTEEITQNVANM